jgi:hypothetical protein
MTTMHNLKFAHNSLAHLLVGLDVDDLFQGKEMSVTILVGLEGRRRILGRGEEKERMGEA